MSLLTNDMLPATVPGNLGNSVRWCVAAAAGGWGVVDSWSMEHCFMKYGLYSGLGRREDALGTKTESRVETVIARLKIWKRLMGKAQSRSHKAKAKRLPAMGNELSSLVNSACNVRHFSPIQEPSTSPSSLYSPDNQKSRIGKLFHLSNNPMRCWRTGIACQVPASAAAKARIESQDSTHSCMQQRQMLYSLLCSAEEAS
jgi:hypothetical protein